MPFHEVAVLTIWILKWHERLKTQTIRLFVRKLVLGLTRKNIIVSAPSFGQPVDSNQWIPLTEGQ